MGLVEAGRAWAAGDDPAQPKLSPINGTFGGLAPVAVYVGTRDLFLPDVVRLTTLMRPAQVDLTVCQGGLHVYPLLPAPEGRAATKEIVRRAGDRSDCLRAEPGIMVTMFPLLRALAGAGILAR